MNAQKILVPEDTIVDFGKSSLFYVGENGQSVNLNGGGTVTPWFDTRLTVQSVAMKQSGSADTIGYRKVKPGRVGMLRINNPTLTIRYRLHAIFNAAHVESKDVQIFLCTTADNKPLQLRFIVPCRGWNNGFMSQSFINPGPDSMEPFTLPLQEAEIGVFLPVMSGGKAMPMNFADPDSPTLEVTTELQIVNFNNAVKELQAKLKALAQDLSLEGGKANPHGVPKPNSDPNTQIQPLQTKHVTAAINGQPVKTLVASDIGLSMKKLQQALEDSPAIGDSPLKLKEIYPKAVLKTSFDEMASVMGLHLLPGVKALIGAAGHVYSTPQEDYSAESSSKSSSDEAPEPQIKPTSTKRVFDLD